MKVAILDQAFHPDVVAVAQYASDLAAELANRGVSVHAIASRRGYDQPNVRFSKSEVWRGVRIVRVPCLGVGKRAKWKRALNFGSYLVNCFLRVLATSRCDVIITMTAPPLLSVVAAFLVAVKGGRLVYWLMDLNPDETIAAGWLRADSLLARLLNEALQFSLDRSDRIVVLDRFMKQRVMAKGVPGDRITIIPPWSQSSVRYDLDGREAFRREHGLAGRFVVMHSGNHSPCHPIETILEAARRLSDHDEIAFCFAGGGSELGKVRAYAKTHDLKNIACLPYQPREKLPAALSAADLHVVLMGDAFVGIVHPCKIYNILALGIPFLYIGPPESHVTDLVPAEAIGDWALFARHGDVDTVVRSVIQAATAGHRRVEAEVLVAGQFRQGTLVGQFIELIEAVAARAMGRAAKPSTAAGPQK